MNLIRLKVDRTTTTRVGNPHKGGKGELIEGARGAQKYSLITFSYYYYYSFPPMYYFSLRTAVVVCFDLETRPFFRPRATNTSLSSPFHLLQLSSFRCHSVPLSRTPCFKLNHPVDHRHPQPLTQRLLSAAFRPYPSDRSTNIRPSAGCSLSGLPPPIKTANLLTP